MTDWDYGAKDDEWSKNMEMASITDKEEDELEQIMRQFRQLKTTTEQFAAITGFAGALFIRLNRLEERMRRVERRG